MLRFLMSGGNFLFDEVSNTGPGIWLFTNQANLTNSAPPGRVNTYAYTAFDPFNGPTQLQTPNLGGNFATLIAGYAHYIPVGLDEVLISFYDNNLNPQCNVRMNATGQLYFERNGTAIGGVSTFTLTPSTWSFIEFKATFSTSGAGLCEVRVNGVTVLSSSGLTNATTGFGGSVCTFWGGNTGNAGYATDFYALDTATGQNISYLGDISVVELYANGPGVNSAWTPNVGPFSITSVANASGGNTVYTGTITGGASNAYVGYNFSPSGFAQSANNGTFECVASTATTITLNNPSGVTDTTGSMPFQCIVQTGAINQAGTRPNGDVAYVASGTPGAISDFAHTPLVLTGLVLGVGHVSYMRKDNMGTKEAAQVCLSGGSSEQSATISLGNTYGYYVDILEVDPNTGTQFSITGLNAATFGVDEIV